MRLHELIGQHIQVSLSSEIFFRGCLMECMLSDSQKQCELNVTSVDFKTNKGYNTYKAAPWACINHGAAPALARHVLERGQ
jgi:hypothetical protein